MEGKQHAQFTVNKQPVHPQTTTSLLSKIFFCWTLPLFAQGYKAEVTETDLYEPLKAHESRYLGDKLEAAWTVQINSRNPSLWGALNKVFGKEIAKYGFLIIFVEFCIKIPQPLLIGKLMEYYVPGQTRISTTGAYLYASLIVLLLFISVMFVHNFVLALQHLGMKIRVACCSLVYRKSLKLSKCAMADTTVGQMVNLLSNDVSRFDMAVLFFHNMWVAPFEAVAVSYILYVYLGPASLAGIGVFVVFIPLQMYLGKRTSVYRLRTALKTDQRVRLMNEIICGIQVIKMYTWEKPFAKLVEAARRLEIKQIQGTSYIRAVNLSLMLSLDRTAIFFCVLAYVLTGNTLESQYVYVATSFYSILKQALTMFLPQGIAMLAETSISIRRIRTFLMYNEVEDKNLTTNGFTSDHKMLPVGLSLENVFARWVPTSPEYNLNNITLTVRPNDLIAIVGPVGSGKSTLLHVILKEIPPTFGNFDVHGRVSYASQEPWLFGGSIRQNILFGLTMDVKRYKEVVKVCALEHDFALFRHGDRSIVGERGAMLSGGQKARINLARAIYKEADIYLLDDPLSAVDPRVGKQLFDNCIVEYLKNKCVILVTHQLQYLRAVNKICVLENGSVTASGTYTELQNGDNTFLNLKSVEMETVDEENKVEETSMVKWKSLGNTEFPVETNEQRSSGAIAKTVYKSYIKAGGTLFVTILCAPLFLLTQLSASGSDYFLNFWVNLEQKHLQSSLSNYSSEQTRPQFLAPDNCLYIYTFLTALVTVTVLTRSLSFFKFSMRASQNLHNTMFSTIVLAPMRFFNTNASGRILNRFSKDMGSIDEMLPQTVLDTLQIGIIVVGIIAIIAVVNPWILIPTFIISGLFYVLRTFFLATSRPLKRVEGTTRSPVFTHMTASLQGLTTIRAFGAQNILRTEFDQHQNLHSSAFYMFMVCNRTFGFWLDLHCVVYIALVTLSFLFLGSETMGGNVGLGITQAISLTGMLQWGMRQWSEMENQMTSVERVVEYTQLTPEADGEKKALTTAWPSNGNIEFQSVSMQYAVDEPLVLKNLSFKVNSGEKIGIVGRTGAGKSSLISALFRLAHIDGTILIDNVATNNIPLNILRSKISIIPQEPVLFSGTLRKNLDPFDEYNDNQLWDALEEVELKSTVSDLPAGLQTKLSEGGSNLSVGQRQLMCLARAVVRSNKILILDEATANVDPQTDELIQLTIRRKFKECTVLTIAHRLHTVIDSDKILVMEGGHAAEFDHPYILLRNKDSIFYGLVEQSGKGMAQNLITISKESYDGLRRQEQTK